MMKRPPAGGREPARTWVKPLWITALLTSLLGVLIIGIYIVSAFQLEERRLDNFCRTVKKGEALADVMQRARAKGLTADPRNATGPFGPSLMVKSNSDSLPSGSFCSVYNDGLAVTSVSYNPWYH